jgi:hypothetical protein
MAQPKPSMSLAQIASRVLEHLTIARATTFVATASFVTQAFGPNASDDRSVRKRVYDILNVLLACRFIEKSGTEVKLVSSGFVTAFEHGREREAKIQMLNNKRKTLASKLNLLVHYHALIRRNQNIRRPANAIEVTAIFLGFSDVTNSSTDRSLDSKSLTILAQCRPRFYSPMDVLAKLGLTKEDEGRIAESLGFDLAWLAVER